MCRPRYRSRTDARGIVTVELALVLFTFLLLTLGTLEVARVMYVLNTAQDVTRVAARAAALTDFSAAAQMSALRRHALLASEGDTLPLLPELGPAQLHIEYLSQKIDGTATPISPGNMPSCPAQNFVNCTRDRHGGSCIGLVRVSICGAIAANGACTPLSYRPMTGIVPGLGSLSVPPSATLVKAESLGYVPGQPNCP